MKPIIALIGIMLGFQLPVRASLMEWNFNSVAPSSAAIADLNQPDVSQYNNNGTTTIISGASASSGYDGVSGGSNAVAAARTGALNTATSGSAAFQFTLVPGSGTSFSVNQISFGMRSTPTGPQAYVLRSSLDGYATDIIAGTIANNSAWSLKTHSGITFVANQSVTFRLFGYNGTGGALASSGNWRIDDLKLNLGVSTPPPLGTAWSGFGNGTTWEDPANWSSGIPDLEDPVIIASGANVTLSSAGSVNSLDCRSGRLTLANHAVFISDDFPLLGSFLGGFGQGPSTLILARGSSATFQAGLIFGGPQGGDSVMHYHGSKSSFTDVITGTPSGIAADADNQVPQSSRIQWNFHIDRSLTFESLTVDHLDLATTTSSHPNRIRLDIGPEGTPFQLNDRFELVSYDSFSGRFTTADGAATIEDDTAFTSDGYTYLINYNDNSTITATVVGVPAAIEGTLVYNDDFFEDQENLNQTHPDTSPAGVNWTAGALFNADGFIDIVDAGASATLPFTPVDGHRYQLQARVNVQGDQNWAALGFVESQSAAQASALTTRNNSRFVNDPTTGKAWMLFRGTADTTNPTLANWSYFGIDTATTNGGTQNGVAWEDAALATQDGGPMDLRILLDTTEGAGNWTATMFAKLPTQSDFTVVRSTTKLFGTQIGAVGLAIADADGNVGSRLESFYLTDIGLFSAAPSITTQPVGQSISKSSTATLTAQVAGTPVPTLQWYRGSTGDTSNPVAGATSATFTTPALTVTTSYWLRAINSQGTADSVTATVTVLPSPEIVVEEPIDAELSAASIRDFGSLLLGATSPVKQFVIRNTGDAPLQNIQVSISGGQADNFILSAAGPPSTITPGGSAIFAVAFSPTTEGAKATTLSIISNDGDENPVVINLFGTGLTPQGIAQLAYLKSGSSGSDDQFGYSVAVSGNTVVVGAPFEDSNATGINGDPSNESSPESGAAYVFVLTGGVWQQQAYLKASNAAAGDLFGMCVGVSGDSIAIGARQQNAGSGAVYVFARSGTTWSQQAVLKASNADAGDLFGASLGISGDAVVVGAPYEDSSATGVNGNQADNSYLYAGAAYVFNRTGVTWTQSAYLKASNTTSDCSYGHSVAVSGDTVVVGAPNERGGSSGVNGNQATPGGSNTGAAYIYQKDTGAWSQQAYLKASNSGGNDYFGITVAASGDTVVVGAPLESGGATGVNGIQDDAIANSGAAYVFQRTMGSWSQQAYLKASNTGAGDAFGSQVGIFGDEIVVGAPSESSGSSGVNGDGSNNDIGSSGAAYSFIRSGTGWSPWKYLKSSNTGSGDAFGSSVAVSVDLMVVGAYGEDSSSAGVNGNQSGNALTNSGSAYIFASPSPQNPALITTQPISQTISSSTSATLTVAASGTPDPTFQWYRGNSGDTSTPVSGATSATFTTPALTATTRYWARATNSQGSADSASALITVTPVPVAGSGLLHRWSFDTVSDSVGGASVRLVGSAALSGGQLELPGSFTPRTNYAWTLIGNNLAGLQSMTVESWFTLDALNMWSKLWSFSRPENMVQPGSAAAYFSPRFGNDAPQIAFDSSFDEFRVTNFQPAAPALATGTEYHVVTVYDSANDEMRFYINGVLAATEGMGGANVGDLGRTSLNYFGAESFFNDPDIDGRINEIRIWNRPLSDAEIAGNFLAGPDQVTGSPVFVKEPSDQSVFSGGSTTVSSSAMGTPVPTYQWYNGESGDTSAPVGGATGFNFTTPSLAVTARYWVQATSGSNSADSRAVTVYVKQPKPGDLLHRWSFDGNLTDSVNGVTARIVESGSNDASLGSGAISLTGGERAHSDYVSLGGGLLPKDGTPATIELWATQNSVRYWSRLFDIGDSDLENLMMAWTKDTILETDRVEWRDSTNVLGDDANAPYVLGTEYHVALVLEPGAGAGGTTRVTWYAAPAGAASMGSAKGSFDSPDTLATLSDSHFWLGRSHYPEDFTANANYNEVRIWNRALTGQEIGILHLAGPEQPAPPPLITTQPLALQSIANGATASLSVVASGLPVPAYQWYRGLSGDTSIPVDGATSADFTTPTLSSNTSYWVRVTNSNGSVDSVTAAIIVTSNQIDQVSIDYVKIGNPGNPADPATGASYGAVPYEYQISKNETTILQYAKFLNAVAKTDSYGLYSSDMAWTPVNGISRSGLSGSFTYSVNPGSENKPITNVSWYDAARFCNWLHNGQQTGENAALTTETGAYPLNGGVSGIVTKNSNAAVWIPSEDEWYKAAYYDPNKGGTGGYWSQATKIDGVLSGNNFDEPNSANYYDRYGHATYGTSNSWTITEVGAYGPLSESAYATNDQAGNVAEWNDAVINAFRGNRGGSWESNDNPNGEALGGYDALDLRSMTRKNTDPAIQLASLGFRVATVSEPSALILSFGSPGNPAMIDQLNKTIEWAVPDGTDVTNLGPHFTLSSGAVCFDNNAFELASGAIRNFSTPQTYIVKHTTSNTSTTYVVTVIVGPEAPAFGSHPLSQLIANSSTATLSVIASGNPAPGFQWYRGISGDISNPIPRATESIFTTPPLTTAANYWVRARNSSGTADSNTARIEVDLSSNADLSGMALAFPSSFLLSPTFTPGVLVYSASVPGGRTSTRVRPTASHPNATLAVRVNGGAYSSVASGANSESLALNVGANLVEIRVTAQDGTTKTYQITMTRERAPDLAVGLSAAATVNMGQEFDYVLTLSNISPVAHTETWGVGVHLPAGVEFVRFPEDNPSSVIKATSGDLAYFVTNGSVAGIDGNQSLTFRVTVKCPLPGTYQVPAGSAELVFTTGYDEDPSNNSTVAAVSTEALAVYSAPMIVTQVVAHQTVTSGHTGSLTFATTGYPVPVYQWYRGVAGDTSDPVAGATSPNFTTPALTETTSYWVRASNSQGTADSITATAEVVPPSPNGNLAGLAVSPGTVVPVFSPFITGYSVSVPNSIASIAVTPSVENPGASVKVNGTAVPSGSATAPIALDVGANTIAVLVTAEDGTTEKTYTLTISRSAPLVLATHPADAVSTSSAVVRGTVTPFDPAVVYFEYGTTSSYGFATAGQDVSGSTPVNVQSALAGLAGNTLYHFRMVAGNSTGATFGNDLTFTTAPEPPVAATGTPLALSPVGATLVGAVNPKGFPVEVYFEYGLTAIYGNATPIQNFPAGTNILNVQAAITGLTPDANYHFRIVANSSAGTTQGNDVVFIATSGAITGGSTPTALPGVATGGTTAVTDTTANLEGTANPNGGPTSVYFQYGTNDSYGNLTASQSVGNGNANAAVSLPVNGLLAGTLYHYRLVASNSLGNSTGSDATFTTKFSKPNVSTTGALALSTTSVRVSGFVRANNADSTVTFDYGTDSTNLNRSLAAAPGTVSGNTFTPVQADLTNLVQGATYYYRVVSTNSGGTAPGSLRSFNVGALSGLLQQFPDEIAAAAHQGSLTVNLTPSGIGGGWRFAGEQQWRPPGSAATGLTTGDRVAEFRPVPGYLQPADETVVVDSGGVPVVLARAYTASGATGSGDLTAIIQPAAIAAAAVAVESRAQWRIFGENDSQWKNSGTPVTGLVPGNYVIESKPVAGRTTPGQVTAIIANGQTTATTITYFIAENPVGTPPAVTPFSTASTRQDRPYAYVGQIRSNAGSSSGFVVRPRVVATAGHVAFDDGTLSATTGLQWLFQRDRGIHEPEPRTPRGFYLMSGYAAQRALDNTPGTSTPQSQNLDAAALYFSEDAGRGGFSGYLASDSLPNEFLTSAALKTLVGYPLDGIPPNDQGRMHATPVGNIGFSSAFGQTYTTSAIRSSGGNSGGPLCIQNPDGTWYPAAIYLGGTAQTVVRAIDSDVLNLFGFAEVSGNAGTGTTGGSLTQTGTSAIGTPTLGAIKINIEPAAARNAGAGWRIQAQAPYEGSGAQINNLSPNSYTVQLATVGGFVPPSAQSVSIQSGLLTTLTFTYQEIISPPVITSPVFVSGTRGQPFAYQITATNSPLLYSLQGVLPNGTAFDPLTGLISGTLEEAGNFPVTVGASNSGGADTREITISSLPVLAAQQATVPYLLPMDYQITSSESAGGATYAAVNLPGGLVLNSATGRITGSPTTAGVFTVSISVAKKGASASSSLTLTIIGSAPVITVNPAASKSIEFGQSTTLAVSASGLPAPAYQWYQGSAGVTGNPVPGATSSAFTTPSLTANASYWVRVSSISGSADSTTSLILLTPSTNANLASLTPGAGGLSPAFNSGIPTYSTQVAHTVSAITLTAVPEIAQSTVRINDVPVLPGASSNPLGLNIGSNVIPVEVTAGNGTTVKTYTLTVNRAAPPAPATYSTGAATSVTDAGALIHGSVNPSGNATAFFQYGLTTGYGNSTPQQSVSGSNPVNVQAALTGLSATTVYHYRIGIITETGTQYGDDLTFTTTAARPLAATGTPAAVTPASAKLIGAVNPRGLETTTYLEYGDTTLYGSRTPDQVIPAGNNVVNVLADITGLTAGATYHYRTVATSAAGTSYGDDVSFQANGGAGSGDGIVDAPPTIQSNSETANDITTDSANLFGRVNPNDGITFVTFEYGPTNAYGSKTTAKSIGNGSGFADVTSPVAGLLPGTEYHYRIIATNSFVPGTTTGPDRTFRSGYFPPIVSTGTATALTATSAQVTGTVRARSATADVFFDYGTDGVTFPDSIRAFQISVTGDEEIPVSVNLTNLDSTTTFYYRVRATSSGGTGTGLPLPLQVGALLGLVQDFTREVPTNDRQGQVQVNLLPSGIGGWRFVGETQWRASGASVTGLTTGERQIEYLPVAGYIQPLRETVGVVSGEAPIVLDHIYYDAGETGTGVLRVSLLPGSLSEQSVPLANRAQWRISGDADPTWKNSGDEISGLAPGSYLVECKPVPGRNTPAVNNIVVDGGTLTNASVTYLLAGIPPLTPPVVIPFATASSSQNLPYAYVGQVRSNSGTHSGFVVKPRVVATVGQAVFDEATLTTTTGLQWLLQRDRGTYEPKPQTPRGFYVFDGYASQRTLEGTPGTLAIESQNLNVAALYFPEDAGRGGFSGFLASETANNEFLQSSSLKTLVGYPMNGISPTNQGRMHATTPVNASFSPAYGRTYTTSGIRAIGGMTGGPLCVQYQGGSYFPAGIYVGGTTQTTIRAIDAGVIDLFTRAENSGNGGDNNTGGGITHTSFSSIGVSSDPGALEVTLLPAEAITAGARWTLSPETTYFTSGVRKLGLSAAKYILQLRTVSGFQAPTQQTVQINGGELQKITFTYLKDVPAPIITSTNSATRESGKTLNHQIVATNTPTFYSLTGILPPGLTFKSNTGLIEGAPAQTGIYSLSLQATNDGGTATQPFTLTVTAPSTALDLWRFEKFGTISNTGNAADNADPDGDGSLNIDEYAAGTNPNNGADRFKILSITKTGANCVLTVSGKATRTYVLERRTTLISDTWTTVTSVGPLAADGTVAISDPSPPPNTGFYRIKVSAP